MNTHASSNYGRRFIRRAVNNLNRRHNGRIYYSARAVIESLEATPTERAMVTNYSDGGLYFESDALITPGAIIYVGISESPYRQSTTTYECHRVRVKWCRDLYRSEFKYGYGVQHLDPIDSYTHENGEQSYDIPQYLKLIIAANAKNKECRKHPRKPANRKVLFTAANQYFEGTITDVSKGGLFIATADKFTTGERIHLVVPGTKFDSGVMIKAEIVRIAATGIGVKLLGLLKKEG